MNVPEGFCLALKDPRLAGRKAGNESHVTPPLALNHLAPFLPRAPHRLPI